MNLGDRIARQTGVPTIEWDSDDGTYYTLLVTVSEDSFQSNVQYLQWLVVNIQGNDIAGGLTAAEYFDGQFQDNDESLDYRYTVLVYKQFGKNEDPLNDPLSARFVE